MLDSEFGSCYNRFKVKGPASPSSVGWLKNLLEKN